MGAYCKFCGHRCFVYRQVIVGGKSVWSGHMATCLAGKAHDRAALGVDADRALAHVGSECAGLLLDGGPRLMAHAPIIPVGTRELEWALYEHRNRLAALDYIRRMTAVEGEIGVAVSTEPGVCGYCGRRTRRRTNGTLIRHRATPDVFTGPHCPGGG